MKFMGSKRRMLTNGLGEVLSRQAEKGSRFVDLFAGSGAVACHVAERYRMPVLANDLQLFTSSLVSAVTSRTAPLADTWIDAWISGVYAKCESDAIFAQAQSLQDQIGQTQLEEIASKSQALLSGYPPGFANAYGGHYFSAVQAILLEQLRANLPSSKEESAVALAALIQTASHCSASPGHTAQPFSPSGKAARFVMDAWNKDVVSVVTRKCAELAERHALVLGQVTQCDANLLVSELTTEDIVFIDPPYSDVHYSRFYHVLETLAKGGAVEVSGVGRYPPPAERPKSDFSMRSQANKAMLNLFQSVAKSGARAVVTFPAGSASNGVSGARLQELASEYFLVEECKVEGHFSTLGGNHKNRAARMTSCELILVLSST